MKKVVSLRNDSIIDFKTFEDIADIIRGRKGIDWLLPNTTSRVEARFLEAKAKILQIKEHGKAKFVSKDFMRDFMWVDHDSFANEHHYVVDIKDRIKARLQAFVLLGLTKDPKGFEYSEAITDLLRIYWHVQGPAADVVRTAIEEIFDEDKKSSHNLLQKDGFEDKCDNKLKPSEINVLKSIFKAFRAGDYAKITSIIKMLDGGIVESFGKDPITNEKRKASGSGEKFPFLKKAIPLSFMEPPFTVSYKENDAEIRDIFLRKAALQYPSSFASTQQKIAFANYYKWQAESLKRQKDLIEAVLMSDPIETKFQKEFHEYYKQAVFSLYNREDNGQAIESLFLTFTNNDPLSEANKKYRADLEKKADQIAEIVKSISLGKTKDEGITKLQNKLKEKIHGQGAAGAGLFDSALETYFAAKKLSLTADIYKTFKENGMRIVEMGYLDTLLTAYTEAKTTPTASQADQEKERLENVKKVFLSIMKEGKLDLMLNMIQNKLNTTMPDFPATPNSPFADNAALQKNFSVLWNYGDKARNAIAEAFVELAQVNKEPRYLLGVIKKAEEGFGEKSKEILAKAIDVLIDLASATPANVPQEVKDAFFEAIKNTGLDEKLRLKVLEKYVAISAKKEAKNLASVLKDFVVLPSTISKKDKAIEVTEALFKKAMDVIIKSEDTEALQKLTDVNFTGKAFDFDKTVTIPLTKYKTEKDAKKKEAMAQDLVNKMYAFGNTPFSISGLNTVNSMIDRFKAGVDEGTNKKLKEIVEQEIGTYCKKADSYLSEYETVKDIYAKAKADPLKLIRDMLKNAETALFYVTLQRINKLLPKLDSSFDLERAKLLEGLKDANGHISSKGLKAVQDYIDKRKDVYAVQIAKDPDLKKIEDTFVSVLAHYNNTARALMGNLKADAFNLATLIDLVAKNPLLDQSFVQTVAEKVLELAKPDQKKPEITKALLDLLDVDGLDKTDHYERIAIRLIELGDDSKKQLLKKFEELKIRDVFACDEARLAVAKAIVESTDNDLEAFNLVTQAKLVSTSNLDYRDKEQVLQKKAYTRIAGISGNSTELRSRIISGQRAPGLDVKQFIQASLSTNLDKKEIEKIMAEGLSGKLVLEKPLWKKLVEQYVDSYDPANGGLMLNSYYKFFRDSRRQLLGQLFKGDALDKEIYKSPLLVAMIEVMIDKFQALKITELDVLRDSFKAMSAKDITDGLDESYYFKSAKLIAELKPDELKKLAENGLMSKESRNALAQVILDSGEANGTQKPLGCMRLIKSACQIGGWEDEDGVETPSRPTDRQARPILNIDYVTLQKLWQVVDNWTSRYPSMAMDLREAYWQKQHLDFARPIMPTMRTGSSPTAERLRNILATGSEGLAPLA